MTEKCNRSAAIVIVGISVLGLLLMAGLSILLIVADRLPDEPWTTRDLGGLSLMWLLLGLSCAFNLHIYYSKSKKELKT